MYFYAALHWVNNYALKRGEISQLQDMSKTTSPHKLRRYYVKRVSRYKGNEDELYVNYKFLFSESMIARYLEDEEFNCINSNAREYYRECNIKDYIDSLETIKRILKKV
jgi:hypothetical protein